MAIGRYANLMIIKLLGCGSIDRTCIMATSCQLFHCSPQSFGVISFAYFFKCSKTTMGLALQRISPVDGTFELFSTGGPKFEVSPLLCLVISYSDLLCSVHAAFALQHITLTYDRENTGNTSIIDHRMKPHHSPSHFFGFDICSYR